jgi:hypothetical protein
VYLAGGMVGSLGHPGWLKLAFLADICYFPLVTRHVIAERGKAFQTTTSARDFEAPEVT